MFEKGPLAVDKVFKKMNNGSIIVGRWNVL